MARTLPLVLLLAAAPALAGDHDHHAPAPSSPTLERLKSLAGDWTMGADGPVVATWRVVGGGSAVAETLFPGSDHEMLTVYHLDGADVVMTHYCAAGNQPHMKLASAKGDKLAFTFVGGTNVDPKTSVHMHDAELTLVDADHLHESWGTWAGGKPTERKEFDLVRVHG